MILIIRSAAANFPGCMTSVQRDNHRRMSGRTINDLGNYDSCIGTAGMKFVLVNYLNAATETVEIAWGQCVGVDCSEDDVAAYFQQFAPVDRQTYQVVARNSADAKNRRPFGAGAWSFVVVICLLILFVGVATTINQRRKIAEASPDGKKLRPEAADLLLLENAAGSKADTTPLLAAPANSSKKKAKPFLELFDAVANFEALVYPKVVNQTAQVFDMLRAMAMISVLFSHEIFYRHPFSQNFVDPDYLDYTKDAWYFTFDEMAFYAVDIFFFMGGYVSIVSMSSLINSFAPYRFTTAPAVWLFCAFKRYLRIMPAYAMLLWLFYKVTPALIDGPASQATILPWQCNSQNFWESFVLGWRASAISDQGMCTLWTWYLAVDFRYYCSIPVILIVSSMFSNKNLAGMTICGSICIISIVWTYVQGYRNEVYYQGPGDPNQTMFKIYYIGTVERAVVYYMGCLFAYATAKPEKKAAAGGMEVKADTEAAGGDKANRKEGLEVELKVTVANKKDGPQVELLATKADRKFNEELIEAKDRKDATSTAFLILCFTVGLILVAGVLSVLHYKFQLGRDVMNIDRFWTMSFLAFGKVVFVTGLLMILMAAVFGIEDFCKKIAGNRLIQLLANLSFTMYLFHLPVIYIRLYSSRSIATYSGYSLFCATMADLSYTLILSLVIVLTVEIPAMHIWRVWLEGPILSLVKKL